MKNRHHLKYGEFITNKGIELEELFDENIKDVSEKYIDIFYKRSTCDRIHTDIRQDGTYAFEDELTEEQVKNLELYSKKKNELDYTLVKSDIINFIERKKVLSKGKRTIYNVFTKARNDLCFHCTKCNTPNFVNVNEIISQIHKEVIDNLILGNMINIEGVGSCVFESLEFNTKVQHLESKRFSKIKKITFKQSSRQNVYIKKYYPIISGKLFSIKNEDDYEFVKNLDIKEYINQSGIKDYFYGREMQVYLINVMSKTLSSCLLNRYKYDSTMGVGLNLIKDVFGVEKEDALSVIYNSVNDYSHISNMENNIEKYQNKIKDHIAPLFIDNFDKTKLTEPKELNY